MSHILVQHMTYFSVTDFEENHLLILEKIVSDFEENRFWFWRKSFSDFGENRFLILKKIVFWFEKIIFWFWRKSFSDLEENRFLIFSRFIKTRFIKLICIRKNCEKIVCKSRNFNTIFDTIYSTFLGVLEPFWCCVFCHYTASQEPQCARCRQIFTCYTWWFNIIYNTVHLSGFVIAAMRHINCANETG